MYRRRCESQLYRRLATLTVSRTRPMSSLFKIFVRISLSPPNSLGSHYTRDKAGPVSIIARFGRSRFFSGHVAGLVVFVLRV